MFGPVPEPARATGKLISDTLEQMRENICREADKMKKKWDETHKPSTYRRGDKVWVAAVTFAGQAGAPKLHCAYYGPYVIDAQISDNAFKLRGLPPGVHPTQNVTNLRLIRRIARAFRNEASSTYSTAYRRRWTS